MTEYKSTITLQECASIMRDMGISTSERSIALGLEQGVLPFGIVIQDNKRIVLISKKQFLEWIESFCGKAPDLTPYMTKI